MRTLRDDRPGRRRRIDPHCRGARQEGAPATSSSEFAASTAAIRHRSISATISGSIMYPARPIAFRSRVLRQRRRHSARRRRVRPRGKGGCCTRGSCHCGEVAFEVETDLEQVLACNCSHCSRKGYLLTFVPRGALRSCEARRTLSTYTVQHPHHRASVLRHLRLRTFRRGQETDRRGDGGDQCPVP